MERFVSSLSSPRSTCNHSPALLNLDAQHAPLRRFGTLLSRARQAACLGYEYTEEAVMAKFGKALLSIPSAWILHTVKRKKKENRFKSLLEANYI